MDVGPKRILATVLVTLVIAATACSDDANRDGPEAATETTVSGSAADSAAATTVEWPVTRCGTFSGQGCAPTEARVDVERPTFSNPTDITNPLFPISELQSVVLLGRVDGLPFRSETTLLADTDTVTIDGEPVEVAVSQYTAYLDGRIDEVALDRYAQADDGSVWYLGEDVFDYREGTVAITEGTWLAGRSGPPAMIMPADPQVGDVYRAENITGVVFEEIEVLAVDEAVDGPRGPVSGAVRMQELHLDGSNSDKVFAPGYGEFDTSSDGEVEALALAYPTDAIAAPLPPELRLISTGAFGVLENARLDDWEAAGTTVELMAEQWGDLPTDTYPPRVVDAFDAGLDALTAAVSEERTPTASQAAIDVAQSSLDLELLYLGDVESDRFHLHAQQLRVHAAASDRAGVAAEGATLEWIRDRLVGSVTEESLVALDTGLEQLRLVVSTGDLAAGGDIAARLAAELRG